MYSLTVLKPINETRGPRGQLTAETASRLLRVRGGRARAAQLAATGYAQLALARITAHRMRSLKAQQRRDAKLALTKETGTHCNCSCHIKVGTTLGVNDAVLLGLK